MYWNFSNTYKGKRCGLLHSSNLLIDSLKCDKLKSRAIANNLFFLSHDSRLFLKWTKYNLKVKIN